MEDITSVSESMIGEYSVSISFCFNDCANGWIMGVYEPLLYVVRNDFQQEICYVASLCSGCLCMGEILILLDGHLRSFIVHY